MVFATITLSFAALIFASCASPVNHSESDFVAGNANINQLYDTLWSPDKSEFDVGTLVNEKQVGLWLHYFKNDTTKWEERYFTGNAKVIKCRFFKNGKVYLEKHYLSNGTYSISYYENGCINNMGFTREVEGLEGEADGLWVHYDSLGNLHSEIIYDFPNNKILYREYENFQLIKECEYYQETSEATMYKNGTWKYYKNGRLERTVTHKMEATLDDFGE